MIPLFKVTMAPEAKTAVAKVLSSGYVGQGPVVEQFEDDLALLMGSRPVTVNSCTSALELALALAGIGPGDLVLSTPITCLATNTVIHNRGAMIAWVDVNPLTGNMDIRDLEHCFHLYPEAKAVMCVDWAGRPVFNFDFMAVTEPSFSFSHRIPVIQDCAHSFGTIPDIGGDYRCYSFQAIKHLTTGDGGALLCPSDQYERAKLLRWYGLDRTNSQAMRCTQTLHEVGYKMQMNDIAAAIGRANFTMALMNVERHKANAQFLCENIENAKISTPPFTNQSSWWLYTVLVHDGRDEFLQHCAKYGIEASLVHARNDYQPALRTTNGRTLPGVDYFAAHEACIPVGWWVDQNDLDHIVRVVNAF